MFNDLREFIDRVRELGELKVVEGADCESEIGIIAEIMAEAPAPPLLMFDRIKGYPAGYRVAANLFSTSRRIALGLGLPLGAEKMELVRALRDRIKAGIRAIPPVTVETGPVMENVDTGDRIDMLKFPAPKWHERDGGRYIGTGSIGITRDPDSGYVNFGTYRTQVQDRTTVTVDIGPANHGTLIKRKYWAKGQACPIAVCCGQAPELFSASTWERVPWGQSEYDFTGGLRGGPVQVIRGVATGLPIPSTAEIAIEGEMVPPEVETRTEGPFGEQSGYYGGGQKSVAACRVKAVLYRDNPIIQGNPPSFLPSVWTLGRHIQKAASLWDELDRHIPGVTGVWMMEEASMHAMPVISIKQQYGGHAKQAALIAAGCRATGRASRIILVVDDDIDPSNRSEVLWALATRIDPQESIDILRNCWASPLDQMYSPEEKRLGRKGMSRALITAVKPYWWKDSFPPSIKTSPETLERIRQKWASVLF